MVSNAAKIPLPQLKQTVASKINVTYQGERKLPLFANEQGHTAEVHDEGTWIFSYADMITILMMFFILLLSISSIDAEKFQQLKGAMSLSSQQSASSIAPGSDRGVNKRSTRTRDYSEPGIGSVPFRKLAETAGALSASDSNAQLLAAISELIAAIDEDALSKSKAQAKLFADVRTKFSQMKAVVDGEAELEQKSLQEIKVSFKTQDLFDRQDNLTAKGKLIFAQVASAAMGLEPFPHVALSAYLAATDEADKRRALKRSSQRAMAVFQLMVENKIEPSLISVAGYGRSKPLLNERDIYGNKIANAIATNNRIEVSFFRRKDHVK